MEDRNMLRWMEKERRSQRVQQEERQYERTAPLFRKPYKRIKDDELSSLIQRMLGNYEDGYDGLEELCPALPYDRSSHFPHVDEQSVHKDHSRAAPDCVSVSGPPSAESWDSLPALCPPLEPLSPLKSSDSDGGPSPEFSGSSRRPDAPPLTHTLPLNLNRKLSNAKKPTAYVRPTVGQDQVTSDSPELKASPESYEHLLDLKDSSKTNLPALQSADSVCSVCAEDILQLDKMDKALRYLEAALSFVESGVAMETEPQTPKSAYTMFSETLDLIRFILKLKNYTDPSAAVHERDFCVLCMRCQALLQMAMFRYRRDLALKHSQTLTDHFKSLSWSASPSVSKSAVSSLVDPQNIQQVAAGYVSITELFLSALEAWEQADEIALRGSGLLRELDSAVGAPSLTSSTSALVRYTRHGLHWIRHDTQNLLLLDSDVSLVKSFGTF